MAKSKTIPIPFTGKWIPKDDPATLAPGDFQTLTNLRYTNKNVQGVTGMTKINTNVVNATYLKPRSGIHFKKDNPAESHVLVQAFNDGLTASRVYDNTTAIPSQGDFTATQVFSDTSNSEIGSFSAAPDGTVAYANGKDTAIWGGSESRVSSFLIGDLSETVKYDYTDQVANTLTDATNVATMSSVATSVDSNTMLLLHLDNNVTDSSPTTVHTVTNTNVTFDNANAKFSYCGVFNGTDATLSIPDNADFDLSGGTWSVDFWMYADDTDNLTIYYQRTDANNFIRISKYNVATNRYGVKVVVSADPGPAEVVSVSGAPSETNANAWHHWEVTESGNSWYIFFDGRLVGYGSDTSRAANYTGVVYIGSTNGASAWFSGRLDEFRVSNTARHTSDFSAPTSPYGASATTCYLYLGTTRPIKGAKFYIGTSNTASATVTAKYWASGAWTAVNSPVDGTSSSGKTLAQTGSVSFSDTVSVAKTKIINNQLLYWYLFTFANIDSTTTVYCCTYDASFQALKDLWDGDSRNIGSCYLYKSSAYSDYSVNVFLEDYLSSSDLTFIDLASITSSDFLLCGFAEKTTGITFSFPSGVVNTNASLMTVYYWDGTTWSTVGTVNDGTREGAATFGKSGTVTWDAPTYEYKYALPNSQQTLWYYYKITFSATFSATVKLDYVSGIPAPSSIKAYRFPVMWQNRLVLLNEYSGNRNQVLIGGEGSPHVFNGSDSVSYTLGDNTEITGGASLFTRFGSSIYQNLIICKANGDTWLFDGTNPGDYRFYQIGSENGCVAPATLKKCDISFDVAPGIIKHVIIWQGSTGIFLFDGNTITPIHGDIANYFDTNESECIKNTMLAKSQAFYEERKTEYHWLFASGSSTTINTELVYNLVKKRWFKIDRGTGKYLQVGFQVSDTNNNKYVYGGIDTGYVERLEYGTTFDGTNITSNWQTGDLALAGLDVESKVRNIKHIAVAKSTTTNSATITHYGDGNLSQSSGTMSHAVKSTTHRLVQKDTDTNWGNYTFHSFAGTLTTSDENVGYEPLAIVATITPEHQDSY